MREVLDALHAPLEAGGDQAGLSSGDEAAPPPSDHRDAGPRGRSSRAAPQLERRPEPGHSVDRCAPEDALRGASLPAFVNGGGVAARFALRSAGAVVAEPSPGETLQVSDEAVLALFGRDRAALLRVIGPPIMMQVERQKECNAQKQQMEAAGQRVPADYCQPVFFYTLQFERVSLLFSSPVSLWGLEQWA